MTNVPPPQGSGSGVPPTFLSMPRRSSYASVVSGNGAVANSTSPTATTNPTTSSITTNFEFQYDPDNDSPSSTASASARLHLQLQRQRQAFLQQNPGATWSGPPIPYIFTSAATPSNSYPPHYIPTDSRAHSTSRHPWLDNSNTNRNANATFNTSTNEMQTNGGGGGAAATGLVGSGWRRPLPPTTTISTTTNPSSTLPLYSRQFARSPEYSSSSYSPYPGYVHSSASTGTSFFTPSYLRNSKYIAQLAAAHRSQALNTTSSSSSSAAATAGTSGTSSSQKDPSQPHPSSTSTNTNPNTSTTNQNTTSTSSAAAGGSGTGGGSGSGVPTPLSSSSSNANLHRLAPSHRGMTHEIIEHPPPSTDDDSPIMPLPSCWSDQNKNSGLDLLNEGLEVRYLGNPFKHEHEAASCRANHPMPPQCGIYYFEVTVLSKPKEGMICVGFTSNKASLERLPGWEQESWAYHGDDGRTFFGESQGQGKVYGPKYSVNDIIGCGVNFSTSSAFFTKNGVYLGNAFRELPNIKLYPAIGVKKQPASHIRANFGQFPFIFDIDGMMKKEKRSIQADISATSISNLHPSLDETTFIQELVAQFLAHGGYVETARAFAKEVREESRALQSGRETPLKDFHADEDMDAINRQKIRSAILEGDIDKALKLTNTSYDNVLHDNPQIFFRLRCRKFIEMMRRCTEPQQPSPPSKQPARSSNGAATLGMHVHDTADDIFTHHMEMDEQMKDVIDDEAENREEEVVDDDDEGAVVMDNEHDNEHDIQGDRNTSDDELHDDGMDVESANVYNGTTHTNTRTITNSHANTTAPPPATANYQDLLHEAILYGQELQADYPGDERREYKRALDDIFSLVAYPDPKSSVHGHLLEPSGRVAVAEELNSAILVSLGKSSSAALEKLYQQTEGLVNEISEDGGAGAFINVRNDFVI
ncbi:uncharacterized protein PADG_04326 [Paracoccidioides brasiliensis Pb18]|uniref:Protein FYV10 n=1 Tax=Paracoccidioides brasiliensis (strain Pb18) TaxID=502780 RepID=C1GAP0_PARBD|nr:uncharacterized protein PADG_04326 [Paracoccidioides brasiliensis Pb18]EEH48242.1 hypothetical protein PADG_04326 [Paracoccidioides brasiliensis Pb18]ODH52345.1 hypothetical protein GX48_01408 [Paracoccidioides brasiliensis]